MPKKYLIPQEWATPEQIFDQFGLRRGTLYKLAAAGKIKWAVVKTFGGAHKGSRLFNVQSIRELVEASVL